MLFRSRQKSRWITGIVLAGWDRLGWSGGIFECWMRLRDRRAVIASIVLTSAYFATILTGFFILYGLLGGVMPELVSGNVKTLVGINIILLFWRVAMRAYFVTHLYGWREIVEKLRSSLELWSYQNAFLAFTFYAESNFLVFLLRDNLNYVFVLRFCNEANNQNSLQFMVIFSLNWHSLEITSNESSLRVAIRCLTDYFKHYEAACLVTFINYSFYGHPLCGLDQVMVANATL